jgi:hypothetical protein
MRRFLFAVVIRVLAAGCASMPANRPVPVQSPEAKQAAQEKAQAALEREVQCLSHTTAQLDDGISIIGRYVGQACHAQIIQAQLLLFQSMPFVSTIVTPASIMEKQNAIVRDAAVQAVLRYRKRQRDNGATATAPTAVR